MTEQEKIRREKLEELKRLGINPYPAKLFPVDSFSVDLLENFNENSKVVIAGRIMSRRIQGNASFAEIQDSKGGSRFILTEMRFAVEMIRLSIIQFIKSY